jgi:hypothetical protein
VPSSKTGRARIQIGTARVRIAPTLSACSQRVWVPSTRVEWTDRILGGPPKPTSTRSLCLAPVDENGGQSGARWTLGTRTAKIGAHEHGGSPVSTEAITRLFLVVAHISAVVRRLV